MEPMSDQDSYLQGDYVVTIPTQNRFDEGSGRGSGGEWSCVRTKKRKKVSSSNMDTSTFSMLSTDDKLACMFERMNSNADLLADVKRKQDMYYAATQDLQLSVSGPSDRTDRVERTLDSQARLLKVLAYRSVDNEARSRRNNLILWGLTERLKVSCTDLVLSFLEDELKLDTTGIVIDRAHRLGSVSGRVHRSRDDPKRPMLRRAYKLRRTGFRVDRDYPKEITEARKELYLSREAVSARATKKKVQIRFPAKLYINGELVSDKFPEWTDSLKKNRLSSRHFEVQSGAVKTGEPCRPACSYDRGDRLAYYEETDVDSSSGSGSGHERILTATQVIPVSGGTSTPVSTDVNKHAHPKGKTVNGVSRDSVSWKS